MPRLDDVGRDAGKDWRVSTAIRIAEAQYRNHKLHVGVIAHECRTSPRYFGRLFRRDVGISFHRFLLNLRMREAGELLRDSSMSVKEMASPPEGNLRSRQFWLGRSIRSMTNTSIGDLRASSLSPSCS